MFKNRVLNNKKIVISFLIFILSGGSLILLYQQLAGSNLKSLFVKVFTYAYVSPYALGEEEGEHDTYTLSGGYYSAPTQGNSDQSQNFEGYTVYEYLYPANPEKNNDDRKQLYSYNANGSMEVSGNLVVNGDSTKLYNDYDSGSVGIASNKTASGEKGNNRHFVSVESGGNDVSMNGTAYTNYQWDQENDSGMGPSVFLNTKSSELEMQDNYSLSNSKKDAIIETSLLPEEDEYVWTEYLNGESRGQLSSPTAFFYRDPVFVIADMGHKRIVAYNPIEESFASLGRSDWNWQLNGVTADEEGLIFVTDSTNDVVIKTKITGDEWEESYKNIDNYQSRLFLDGSENFKVYKTFEGECVYDDVAGENVCTSNQYFTDYGIDYVDDESIRVDWDGNITATGTHDYQNDYTEEYRTGRIAAYAQVLDCGYNSHQVTITSALNYIALNTNDEPMMLSHNQTECAFGGACFNFDGSEYIDIPDAAAWNFGSDFFTIDMWVKFNSLTHTMAIVSHPGSFLFELERDYTSVDPPVVSLNFSFSSIGADGGHSSHSFKEAWPENRDGGMFPEIGEWYHLAIVRSDRDELTMYVDGEALGEEPTAIGGTLVDGEGRLQIGAYYKRKKLVGQIDEIRIARGHSQWEVNYADLYKLNNPKGIILVDEININGEPEEVLYVVDSGHHRIVRMSKDFHSWSTFGGPEPGSGDFQFNNPTDIYYHGGRFYVTDTGNNRVISVRIDEMVHYLKGESRGDWRVEYEGDSPDLHGVMVDNAGSLLITDAYNAQIIKDGEVVGNKNPWDLLFSFTAPVDIQQASENNYYILDGISNTDFSSNVGNRALDLYGTSQKDGLNVRFSTGGVMTTDYRSQDVVSRLNEKDWQIWVGDDAGPGVAHCPEIENEVATLSDTDCEDRWTGLGQHVDCRDPNVNPDYPSECVGQWDWESVWPSCLIYAPGYDEVEVCTEKAWCNSDTSHCTTEGYIGTDASGVEVYRSAVAPSAPVDGVTYVYTCIVYDDFTPDGSHSGDYECGCAESQTECFSYCEPVDPPHDCHEGFAVAHEWLELGPPEWAPEPVLRDVPTGSTCSAGGIGNGSGYNLYCNLCGSGFSWEPHTSNGGHSSSRAQIYLPYGATTGCDVWVNGELALRRGGFSVDLPLYNGEETVLSRGEEVVRQWFIADRSGEDYGRNVVVYAECCGSHSDKTNKTWIIPSGNASYSEPYTMTAVDCSATLSERYWIMYYNFERLRASITEAVVGLSPGADSLDDLVLELNNDGYAATRVVDNSALGALYGNATFTNACNSRGNVNDYFIVIDVVYNSTLTEHQLIRVLGPSYYGGDSWMTTFAYQPDLDYDIEVQEPIYGDSSECSPSSSNIIHSCPGSIYPSDCYCSDTLAGVSCSRSPGGVACAIEIDIMNSVGGLDGYSANIDVLVARLRAMGHSAYRLNDSPSYSDMYLNYQPSCGGTQLPFEMIDVDGMLFRVLGVYRYGGTRWIAEYNTVETLQDDINRARGR